MLKIEKIVIKNKANNNMVKANHLILVVCIFTGLVSCKTGSDTKTSEAETKFEETWESLATIEREPEWFKDAKFGIYFHWGVYSVPAYSTEWYPRWMYVPGRKAWGGDIFEHHKKTFGPVSQ